MRLLDRLSGRAAAAPRASYRSAPLTVERLERRCVLASAALGAGGALVVNGDFGSMNRIFLTLDPATSQIVVEDNAQTLGTFASSSVSSITVNANGTRNLVRVDPAITQPATLNGGPGTDWLFAGGGPTTLNGGTGVNRLVGGGASDSVNGTLGDNVLVGGGGFNDLVGTPRSAANSVPLDGITPPAGNPLVSRAGRDLFLGFHDRDAITGLDPAGLNDRDLSPDTTPPDLSNFLGLTPSPDSALTAAEVTQLLDRAAAATASDDGIVAIVDRGGRVLGVRVEAHVDPAITGNTEKLVFAIDGAIAEARTGAFFGNDQAPLTSRTIQFISQTTNTQREIESDPSITDPNSTLKGPGFVAPIRTGGHFPPGVPYTPQVDLFGIEGTNRDTTMHPVYDANGNVISRVTLPERFNVNPAFLPSDITDLNQLVAPDSYGFISGLEPDAQPRGIGTLPGGIPIYAHVNRADPTSALVQVGGIGVFFPGKTGFADEENSALSSNFNPAKPDRAFEAEYVAFAALGGSTAAGFPIGTLGGIAPLQGFDLPAGRIDLVGITLDIFGPDGTSGPGNLVKFGQTLGTGDPNSGVDEPVFRITTFQNPDGTGGFTRTPMGTAMAGTEVPEGWLVLPHAGKTLTAAQVTQIIVQGVAQAQHTRAAIRLPLDSTTRMVFSVSDPVTGEVLGLFRMPDATIFSIDVAVAKSRNVQYYADPNQLQPVDQLPGVPAGVAFTNRTFRYLALPFYPEGIDGQPPGFFSTLNVPGTDQTTSLLTAPPLPASAYFNNVRGHDVFFPQTNFHDPNFQLNQNGIVFFPGSVPLYVGGNLIGGFGVSGDGVDQDDVVTFAGKQGFDQLGNVQQADDITFRDVRLPYQKFNRQPLEP
jgi:uncharacterized protein GlcG (DUF336 family)